MKKKLKMGRFKNKFSLGIKVPIKKSTSSTTTTSTTSLSTTTTSSTTYNDGYYGRILDPVPLHEIEKYLRRKKLKNIKK